jgi:curli biogenesis system outer membrane secretion channel CsgG
LKPIFKFIFIYGVIMAMALLLTCCSSKHPSPVEGGEQQESIDWSKFPAPPETKELVAVAGFENKSTYSADKLWDTSSQILSSSLIRANYFRVVEWEKMKQLFDWDTLSHASLVKSPENLQRAQRVLLCEYFISGSITYFDVSQRASVSAMSKSKVIDTTVRVDLLLQDARTGEYLSTGSGEQMIQQAYEGGLSGGQTGGWSSLSADKALTASINKALLELVENFARMKKPKG